MAIAVPRALRSLAALFLSASVVVGATTSPAGAGHRRELPKPPVAGLVDRAGVPSDEAASFVNAFVIRANWSDLQPVANQLNTTVVDSALAQAPPGSLVKLRIYGGVTSPAWAMNLDGPPVTLFDPDTSQSIVVPRFWGPKYGQAYAALQSLLAARYDANPLLVEVTVSRCMTSYAETLLRMTGVQANVEAYRAAGFTAELDVRCLGEQIDAHAVWKRTRTGVALNPYQRILSDGRVRTDVSVTIGVMDRCRALLGKRCVLENNSVRWPVQDGDYTPMYQAMKERGGPITVQTAAPDRIGSWPDALRWAADYLGAGAVELPRRYEDWDRQKLVNIGQRFVDNASLTA